MDGKLVDQARLLASEIAKSSVRGTRPGVLLKVLSCECERERRAALTLLPAPRAMERVGSTPCGVC